MGRHFIVTTCLAVAIYILSMYFDEDGDLAHEFYEEVKPSKQGEKARMRLLTERLSPQGVVDLPYPRLHVDFPIVMCKAWS